MMSENESRYLVVVRDVDRNFRPRGVLADFETWTLSISPAPYAEQLAKDIATGLRDHGWDATAQIKQTTVEDL